GHVDARGGRGGKRERRPHDIQDALDQGGHARGHGTGVSPLRARLELDLEARVLNHQADAPELTARAGAPAQQAEVKAARRPKAKASHGTVVARLVRGDSGAPRTCLWRSENAVSSTGPPVLATTTASLLNSSRICDRGRSEVRVAR